MLLTSLVSITNVFSIALRSYAIRFGLGLHVAMVVIPMAGAFVIRGGWFLTIALLMVPLSLFVYSSAVRLRNILLSEMSYRQQSEFMAGQFDLAINNMSHGMCMISASKRIEVSNSKFAEFFGLPETRPLTDVSFKALLRLAGRHNLLTAADSRRVLNSLTRRGDVNAEAYLQIEAANGSVCDLTIKPNTTGGWVVVLQDVTEKRNADRAIHHMAHFDAVTNLRNRHTFEMALTEALEAATVAGSRTEVLFLDLDGFKQVNDTLGHKVGDQVLAVAGQRLVALAAEQDLVARWGGDEFVVLRSGLTGPSDAGSFAERLIAEISVPCSIDGADVVVGASIGIAVAMGGGLTTNQLLQYADMALYAAKRDGRGRFRLYEDSMSASALERRLLELDLHAALANQAFELKYQPIVDFETREVVSFEALARWRHGDRGDVSPAVFVPVLEDLNLMQVFGAWALRKACQDASRWPAHIRIAVNVSARQLEADGLFDDVQRALEVSGLAANRLELEITETALLSGGDFAAKTLARIRELGVRVALDDFGTGYSSLSHLMRFPLDKVKIDQSFTRMVDRDPKAQVLIENIARLSTQLGMVVTVEGIETIEQFELVRRLGGAKEAQGYLFARPLALADADKLVLQARQRVA